MFTEAVSVSNWASVRINPWKSRSQENPLYLIQSLVFQLDKSSKFLAVECIQLHWPLMGLCTPGDAMTRKPLAVQAQRTYHSRSTSKSLSMGSQLAILTPLHIILIQTKFFIGDVTGTHNPAKHPQKLKSQREQPKSFLIPSPRPS